MPNRFISPPQLREAMLIVETGLPPEVLAEMPERLLGEIVIYKSVKNVAEYGGEWQP